MTPETTQPIILACLEDMSARLGEAASLARAATACAAEDNASGAITIALDVEPLIGEANALLQAASLLHRKARG